ncbi:MAG: methyltransferase [Desulfuromonas sp.]|nr:methyltransferase [Desulfuromonas sp.]
MELLSSPHGQLKLCRSTCKHERLRAWDAADEYILTNLHEQSLLAPDHRLNRHLVIINDGFGALSCALADNTPDVISDSFISYQAMLANLADNDIDQSSVNFHDSLNFPSGHYDVVVIKIPKSLALLEYQLYRLRPHLHQHSTVIAAGMVKTIHRSTLELFETIIGATTTSKAKKKARLIFSQPQHSGSEEDSPYPLSFLLPDYDLQITNHANVFSQQKLDIGSRFFLEHCQQLPDASTIADLGCGNGVLGIIAARQHPQARSLFVDESYMAIESARINFKAEFPQRTADFKVTDCLHGVEENSVDLILNNPPFHQQQVVGDETAWQMFQQARKVLKKSGQLWVVGNRHLGYHTKIKRTFGNCELIAGNQKFVLLRAWKN